MTKSVFVSKITFVNFEVVVGVVVVANLEVVVGGRGGSIAGVGSGVVIA